MIVRPVHQPHLVWHARRIRAQRIVISLHVHDALPCFSSCRTVSQKIQRSLSLNHSCAELSSYLIRRGTKIVAVNCECACAHSSPASAPWFLKTLTYLNRASFFKSAIRDAHTHNTRSISSSLNCDIRLSCSGVSTTTSWAPRATILSYIPSATRPGSPSM